MTITVYHPFRTDVVYDLDLPIQENIDSGNITNKYGKNVLYETFIISSDLSDFEIKYNSYEDTSEPLEIEYIKTTTGEFTDIDYSKFVLDSISEELTYMGDVVIKINDHGIGQYSKYGKLTFLRYTYGIPLLEKPLGVVPCPQKYIDVEIKNQYGSVVYQYDNSELPLLQTFLVIDKNKVRHALHGYDSYIDKIDGHKVTPRNINKLIARSSKNSV